MIQGQSVVLVVDDDVAVRDSLKFSLELEGLLVQVFGSGAELLALPDLPDACCLVLDYKMPVMDGFEVLARLAADRIELPVILITSPATEAIRRRAAAAGVEQVLEKPLLDSTLVDHIRSILSRIQ
jgi:two-component system response regulator FixJ